MNQDTNPAALDPYYAEIVNAIKNIHLPTETRTRTLQGLDNETALLAAASSWHDFADRAADRYIEVKLCKLRESGTDTWYESRCGMLSELARVGQPIAVRCAAVRKHADRLFLAHLAESDAQYEVRLCAVENRMLSDQVLLSEVAQTDPNEFVRHSATRKLTNQAVLAGMAKTQSNIEDRLTIARKLDDPAARDSLLAGLLTETNPRVAREAAQLMSTEGLAASGFRLWRCPECGGRGFIHIEYGWDADCTACGKDGVRLFGISR